ncbi:MAG: hypothetical protein WC604_01380 [Candidatus Gracilibacteria bacterium]
MGKGKTEGGNMGEYFDRTRALTESDPGDLRDDLAGGGEHPHYYLHYVLLSAIHEAVQRGRDLTFEDAMDVLQRTFPDKKAYRDRKKTAAAISRIPFVGRSRPERFRAGSTDVIVARLYSSDVDRGTGSINGVAERHSKLAMSDYASDLKLSGIEKGVLDVILFQYWGIKIPEIASKVGCSEAEVMTFIDDINRKIKEFIALASGDRRMVSLRIIVRNGVVALAESSGCLGVPLPNPDDVRRRIAGLLREAGVLKEILEDMTGHGE